MIKLGYVPHCQIQTSLNNNFYFVGGEVLLGLEIDNSICSKSIDHFYWKIVRCVSFTGSFKNQHYKYARAEIITEGQKKSCCKGKGSEKTTVQVELPAMESNLNTDQDIDSLTPSVTG